MSSNSSNQNNLQHAVLLDEHGQPTDEVVVLQANDSGEYNIVERMPKESNSGLDFVNLSSMEGTRNEDDQQESNFQQHGQTIIICQDGDDQHQVFIYYLFYTACIICIDVLSVILIWSFIF